MEEALLIQERVKHTIILGESHFREFKTALEGKPGNKKPRLIKKICEDIGEALVAFANADGGEILIGVEDDGTITGIPHDEEGISAMLAAVKTHIYKGQELPLTASTKLILNNQTILYFSVNKGTTQIYQLPDGRCVRRKDTSTIPASINQIQFSRREIRSREYEGDFVDGALVTDLDLGILQTVAASYSGGLSVELYLQQIGLAVFGTNGLRLKRAAVLLFAKSYEINRWHPRCQIRFLKVHGDTLESGEKYNVISDESIQGNIFDLCMKAWEGLRPYLAYQTTFSAAAGFEQKYTYPEEACKEALLNAIVHRDYSIQNGIEIYIYDTSIEIKSPGTLLSTLSIKNLYELEGAHESRNPLIARVLRENKLMRELGEGMRRIFDAMYETEFERPALYSNGVWFSITLSRKNP
jgi:ATP-dependent DNA helicase RecG